MTIKHVETGAYGSLPKPRFAYLQVKHCYSVFLDSRRDDRADVDDRGHTDTRKSGDMWTEHQVKLTKLNAYRVSR